MTAAFFEGNLAVKKGSKNFYTPAKGDKEARIFFNLAIEYGRGEDKTTHFLPFTAYGSKAENLHKTIEESDHTLRLVVGAYPTTYTKEVTEGDRTYDLTMVTYVVTSVGPSLLWADAKVNKSVRGTKRSNEEDWDQEPEDKPKGKSKGKAKAEPKAKAKGKAKTKAKAKDEESDDESW